ncbi:glucosamine-6-phosphate deaminase [Paenibacillus dendritiformis]|uniref:glucosamine-6-phosphate deaminase n=1 Tax=Paenibacillus dendritiformis TaxID=130049 RepID=UPI003669E401
MTAEVRPIASATVDRLQMKQYDGRINMGRAAAAEVAAEARRLLEGKERVRIVFAAAPSQNEFLDSLASEHKLPWERITALHMDEYIGLPAEAPQRFGRFLQDRLFGKVQPGTVHYLDGMNDPARECGRYAGLVQEAPIDIVCLGIGENGHLAFNDPPTADFRDPAVVKPVELDEACRRQQVHDGCFATLEEVPRRAITLTVPTLLSGSRLFCIVPGRNKRDALSRALYGPVGEAVPASALRLHPACVLYADRDSWGGGGE